MIIYQSLVSKNAAVTLIDRFTSGVPEALVIK